MSVNGTAKLNSAGGPLFRKPGLSHEEFTTAWHRHGRFALPWCLNAGTWEYIQIHMPSQPDPVEESEASDDTVESKARRTLQQADGVAIMRRYDVPAEKGNLYFQKVILVDERTFLHDESGAGAVKGNLPAYDVPELHVDVWREMALRMGGVEHVKIREGKDVIGNAMWEEWEKIEREKEAVK
ncbi:hypothetical protein GQX73_g5667 [Xylaria multiplex]|uniref:EthD domain-containing protein n=1 Tax=Xylaria multiplex TaxID=323545 RepID=A0A7C8N440_9PEZI|nr:hypothetical protein GQX73_g5667 [Xylaria multiplex]